MILFDHCVFSQDPLDIVFSHVDTPKSNAKEFYSVIIAHTDPLHLIRKASGHKLVGFQTEGIGQVDRLFDRQKPFTAFDLGNVLIRAITDLGDLGLGVFVSDPPGAKDLAGCLVWVWLFHN
jgi:hypothetical protein